MNRKPNHNHSPIRYYQITKAIEQMQIVKFENQYCTEKHIMIKIIFTKLNYFWKLIRIKKENSN